MSRQEGKNDGMAKFVAVARISDGILTYSGKSAVAAATALDPGTCFGTDENEEEAQAKAKTAAWVFSRIPPPPRSVTVALAYAQALIVGKRTHGK